MLQGRIAVVAKIRHKVSRSNKRRLFAPNGRVAALVLLREKDPDKVEVTDFARHARAHWPGRSCKDAVDDAVGEAVIAQLDQVLLVQEKVVVRIKLPEVAVTNIEMLIRKVIQNLNKNSESAPTS